MHETVLVPIPYYGCKEYIRRAVVSVLEQTYENVQLVVVNDGDLDAPWDAIEDLTDGRLWRFELAENFRPYFIFELLLRASRAQYLLVQEADDWSEPSRAAELMAALKGGCGAALSAQVLYGDEYGFRSDSKPTLDDFGSRLSMPPRKAFEYRGLHHGLYSTEALRAIGGCYAGYDVNYDVMIVNLMHMYMPIAYVQQPLYHRVKRAGSLTLDAKAGHRSRYREQVVDELGKIHRECYGHYRRWKAGVINRMQFSALLKEITGRNVDAERRTRLEELVPIAARWLCEPAGPIRRIE